MEISVQLHLIGQSDIDSLRRDAADLIIYGDSASPLLPQVFPL